MLAAGGTVGLRSLLFEVRTLDPVTNGAVAVLLLLASVAACGIPAWRAGRVDPACALRAE